MNYAIVTHGGAASPHAHADGCAEAAARARAVLERGGDALAAALEATAVQDEHRPCPTASGLCSSVLPLKMTLRVLKLSLGVPHVGRPTQEVTSQVDGVLPAQGLVDLRVSASDSHPSSLAPAFARAQPAGLPACGRQQPLVGQA
jgi:hypothetical protein